MIMEKNRKREEEERRVREQAIISAHERELEARNVLVQEELKKKNALKNKLKRLFENELK